MVRCQQLDLISLSCLMLLFLLLQDHIGGILVTFLCQEGVKLTNFRKERLDSD